MQTYSSLQRWRLSDVTVWRSQIQDCVCTGSYFPSPQGWGRFPQFISFSVAQSILQYFVAVLFKQYGGDMGQCISMRMVNVVHDSRASCVILGRRTPTYLCLGMLSGMWDIVIAQHIEHIGGTHSWVIQ